jgi:hypothetical protein
MHRCLAGQRVARMSRQDSTSPIPTASYADARRYPATRRLDLFYAFFKGQTDMIVGVVSAPWPIPVEVRCFATPG